MVEYLCDRVGVMYHGPAGGISSCQRSFLPILVHGYTQDSCCLQFPFQILIRERNRKLVDYMMNLILVTEEVKEISPGHFVLKTLGGGKISGKA